MISSRFPSAGGQRINNSTPVEVVAVDQIKIGDTVYAIKNDPILRGDLRKQGFTSSVNTAVFSPDGSTLVIGGGFTGYAKVYSVDGTTVTYVSDIYADTGTTALSAAVDAAVFSPDGSTLVIGGYFQKFGIIYQVDNNTIRYEDRTLAYLAPNGIIKNNYSSFSIGFSKSNIGVWANGTVYTIADVITK